MWDKKGKGNMKAREIPDGARCILYTRVSKPSQAAEEKASLDAQLAACKRLAAELGHTRPAVVEDKGRSAFKEKKTNAPAASPGSLVPRLNVNRNRGVGPLLAGVYTDGVPAPVEESREVQVE